MRIKGERSHGYTIVELLIVVTITGILLASGISAYGRAQQRQQLAAAKETILSALQDAQKAAYVGEKNCIGALTGVFVSISGSSISATPVCESGPGSEIVSETVTDLTFAASTSFTFLPLKQGISFQTPGQTYLDLDYSVNDSPIYRVRVENPGIITYLGLVND